MENITKEEFQRFLAVRNSGRINMTDIVTGSILAQLSESKYETILWNFNELSNKYGTRLKPAVATKAPQKSSSTEISRFSKYKNYIIEFYVKSNDKLGKCLNKTEISGIGSGYDLLELVTKVCHNKLPNLVHVIEKESNKELWQYIHLSLGPRCTEYVNKYIIK